MVGAAAGICDHRSPLPDGVTDAATGRIVDTDTQLRTTPLAALHAELGARMLPFAGYSMPVQYPGGMRHEHEATRTGAGLFDVSHMGQLAIHGPLAALEALVTGDLSALAPWRQRYTVLTDPRGGIIDDLMVTHLPAYALCVVNAAFADSDCRYLRDALPPACTVEQLHERALLALQGPAAVNVLARYDAALASVPFMAARETVVAGVACLATRGGYTGEDGFELALAARDAEGLARSLLAHAEVAPCGLGARDSLRLEAGLCLSGTDIDAGTTPVEADLGWVVAKKYRGEPPLAQARFPGANVILDQLAHGTARLRVGLRPDGRVPLRGGTEIHDHDGHSVGTVTSGTVGPTAGGPVAMGYLRRDCATPGTRLAATIRARVHAVTVTRLPFVPHRYYRTPN